MQTKAYPFSCYNRITIVYAFIKTLFVCTSKLLISRVESLQKLIMSCALPTLYPVHLDTKTILALEKPPVC